MKDSGLRKLKPGAGIVSFCTSDSGRPRTRRRRETDRRVRRKMNLRWHLPISPGFNAAETLCKIDPKTLLTVQSHARAVIHVGYLAERIRELARACDRNLVVAHVLFITLTRAALQQAFPSVSVSIRSSGVWYIRMYVCVCVHTYARTRRMAARTRVRYAAFYHR